MTIPKCLRFAAIATLSIESIGLTSISGFQFPSTSSRVPALNNLFGKSSSSTRGGSALHSFYANSGSDANVNRPRSQGGGMNRDYFQVDREQQASPAYYDDYGERDFPYDAPYMEGGMGSVRANGSFGPMNGRGDNRFGRYDNMPMSGMPSSNARNSYFNGRMNNGRNMNTRGQPMDYYGGNPDEMFRQMEGMFPVLSQIAGMEWQGTIKYLDGNLQATQNANTRRNGGIRYEIQPDGMVQLTISLSGRRIEMRGQKGRSNARGGVNLSPRPGMAGNQRNAQRGMGRDSQSASIRLDPMDDQDPNYMVLTEMPPDTILINEIDRVTGKVVLTGSLSIANPDEIVLVSHEIGSPDMPIECHQIWSLVRPGGRIAAGRNGPGMNGFSNERRNPSTGIPQRVMPSGRNMNGMRVGGPRMYPVLSKFSGITWEGTSRQVSGDLSLRSTSTPRMVEGGSRFDLFDDGFVSLTTFLRSPNTGRTEAIEMRGRRMEGPGSPIRLDMEEGPNSMLVAEVAPNTLIMHEINRETGQILFTASLFLANDGEAVQVSHQIARNQGRRQMPIDMHQIWRLFASPENEMMGGGQEWMGRQSFDGRMNGAAGGSFAQRGGTGMKPMFEGATAAGRGTGRRSERERKSNSGGQFNENSRSQDDLWLLNRTPEQTRNSFREKYNSMEFDSEFADDWGQTQFAEPIINTRHPVLSKISGIEWQGSCRYIIGDTKPDSIMLLSGGIRYDLDPDGLCTMTTTLVFGDGRKRQVRMQGVREPGASSLRLYPVEATEPVYTVLTELTPDTILLNEVDIETGKVIYTASLSLSSDGNEVIQITHEMGDSMRMPVEGHQVWRMKPYGEKSGLVKRPNRNSWIAGTSSSLEELFPVLSQIDGVGWQGTFRFINGDLERSYNFEATGKMWYDLNRNGTCVWTVVSSLPDGSSRYVQMRGERGPNPQDPIRLDPVDTNGPNYMVVTELPPDTVLLNEIEKSTGKLVSTASLSVYRNEIIQISHEIGNSTKLDGHQIARLTRTKDLSRSSRGTMSYLLNGESFGEYEGRETLTEIFPVLNQIDGINWQGACKEIDVNMREQRGKPIMTGGMRYDLWRNGTCTMTSMLAYPDGRVHEIILQGRRVGKTNKRSIRLDPISEDSPFYTVLTEVPPDTILLNEVDKATNKVIFTASVTIAGEDELIQISKEVDDNGESEEGHKLWRLRRSPTLGPRYAPKPNQGGSFRGPRGGSSFRDNQSSSDTRYNGQTYFTQGYRTGGSTPPDGARQSYRTQGFRSQDSQSFTSDREQFYSQKGSGGYDSRQSSYGTSDTSSSFGSADRPFGEKKPKDPNLLFDY